MILNDFGSVVLSFNYNSVLFVCHNRNVFLDLCPAQKFFVGFCNYSRLLLFLNDVQINDWKGTVNFDSINVFSDVVTTDVCFTCQSYFYSKLVLYDVVVVNFEFKLFADSVNC